MRKDESVTVAVSHPHVLHHPQTDSNQAILDAERARNIARDGAEHPQGVVCAEGDGAVVAATAYCERHLRGRALAVLDRRRWPRLNLGGRTIAGDDQWRPWLREAGAAELAHIHQPAPPREGVRA